MRDHGPQPERRGCALMIGLVDLDSEFTQAVCARQARCCDRAGGSAVVRRTGKYYPATGSTHGAEGPSAALALADEKKVRLVHSLMMVNRVA